MPTKTDRILSYLPSTFRALPKPTALYSVADAFGNELLQAENSLAALMLAHWVDHADRGAELIDDLARIAALYGLAPRPEESVEEFREHLKRYVRTFLDGTVTAQGILRVTAEALGLHIADAYDQMDAWWTRGNETLITVEPRGDDAALLLFGVDAASAKGQAILPARIVGKVDLGSGVDLSGGAKLRLKLDAAAPVDIDLAGLTTLEQIEQAINAQVSGAASKDGGRLVLHSPTKGAASRLEVQEIPDDAAPRLLGLLPHSYRGTVATKAAITSKPHLSGEVDLSEARYLRLLIDGQHLAEVDCAAKAADPSHPTAVQLEQIKQAINEALGPDVASHDGKYLILTSPTSGFNSSIAFQPAAAQDAKARLFGPIETFRAGRDARPAEAVGIHDLSRGVDLSTRTRLRIRVDSRPPVTVFCAGNDPANTLLSEITAALTAQLGLGTAFHDGRFLHLASPTAGPASSIVFESLPPDEDAAEILFGVSSRIFTGSDATNAGLVGTPDLSVGVDLAALHAIQIAVDGGEPVEVNAHGEAVDARTVKPNEIAKAINTTLKKDVASHDGHHIILTSQITGEASQIIIKPLTVIRHRRFVTRAFTTDDAAQAVFGFFSKEAQGTPATAARVVGMTDLSRGVDLREARFLRLSIDGDTAVDVDCSGARPRATLVDEVVSKINSELHSSVASRDGGHLILTSPSAGGGSRIQFEPNPGDAVDILLGAQPATFRGRDASRVTFTGVIDLSAGIDLPANAAVKLRVDGDELEIPLTEAAPIHKTLNEIVIAINLKFDKIVAHHDSKHLILASPSTGSASRIEFLVPSGTDSTKVIFGITSPRTYHGEDAKSAEVVGKDLLGTTDLSVARFLRLAINGGESFSIDGAKGISDPKQSTLAEIVENVKAALTTARIPGTAKAEANRLILATTTTGATSRIALLPYTEGDARSVLLGEIPDVTTGNDPAPAIITGEIDLLASANLAEARFLRLSVDGGRPVDVDIAGAAPATTFLDEIVGRINAVVPGLASSTDNDRLRLTSPTTDEESRLEVLPLRALELIEYPPEPTQDPIPEQPSRAVRHGDRWSVENDGAAEADLRIVLNAPHGVLGPGFVNHTQGLRIRLMIVLHPGESAELWREPAGNLRAEVIAADGSKTPVPDAQVLAEALDEHKSCEVEGEGPDKAAALVLPQGRSEWAYLDCRGARFNRDRFAKDQHDPIIKTSFAGKTCAEWGVFNVSRFTCPPPSTESTVFASAEAPPDPSVNIRFHWLQHRAGAFTVNLPADLPEQFGGRFNQARFAKAGDKPEEFKDVVTEPDTDPDFLVKRIASSALVTAKQVDRVPIGFVAVTMPFRKPRRLAGGSDTTSARLYLAEKDVTGFIELSASQPGAWGNAIAVSARKSGPARFDVTVSYQGARFENARRIALGGDTLPALTEDLLKPGPVGVLQAKARGVKATVTRDRAEVDD
ncbi:MAG: hypothetical protein C3F12_08760 [Candidatus Methylomirabilota bacterium]|nr:MAG: hypothetical protein C3F12_08760 [candidate division NC10 bacterium]